MKLKDALELIFKSSKLFVKREEFVKEAVKLGVAKEEAEQYFDKWSIKPNNMK